MCLFACGWMLCCCGCNLDELAFAIVLSFEFLLIVDVCLWVMFVCFGLFVLFGWLV